MCDSVSNVHTIVTAKERNIQRQSQVISAPWMLLEVEGRALFSPLERIGLGGSKKLQ